MASRKDMQDIMGLPAGATAGPKAAVQKKAKPALSKRLTGIGREVQALMGERPPPVAVYDEKMTYKAKRSTGPAKKWEQAGFTNNARLDGLVLRHWRRKGLSRQRTDGPDALMEDVENQDIVQRSPDYEFSRFNVKIAMPEYTDDEYTAWLQDEDWTREETDYLMSMVREFYYRWPAIWDRYDFQPLILPSSESDAPNPPPSSASKPRTMEDLKYRFYRIQARLMALKTPESNMTQSEYSLWDILQSYNPRREHDRKVNAAGLMHRTLEEAKEEEILLGELQRIAISAERMEAERSEIRTVHDAPHATSNSVTQFQSSQALTALFNTLFQQDRSKKRASTSGAPGSGGPGGRLSLNTTDLLNTPSGATPPHRDSLTATTAGGVASATKKGGVSASSAHPARALAPEAEKRFGVTTHDRLQSGVAFRSDKMFKLRQAKSGAQTLKMAEALAELGVPDVVTMPSAAVCEAFERLVQKVGKLLEVRKHRVKEEGEFKVVENMVAELKRRVRKEEGIDAGEDDDDEEEGKAEKGDDGKSEADDGKDSKSDSGSAAAIKTGMDSKKSSSEDADEDEDDAEPEADGDADEDSDANSTADVNVDDEDDAEADDDDDEEEDDDGEEEADEEEEDEDEPEAVEDDDDADGEVDLDEDEADADGETETNGVSAQEEATPRSPPLTLAGHKRSASVLSVASSAKSNKRTRK